jgi:hypothetical protein
MRVESEPWTRKNIAMLFCALGVRSREIFSSPKRISPEYSSLALVLLPTGAAWAARPGPAQGGLGLPAGGGCAAVPDSHRYILVGQGCIAREIEHAQAILLHLQVKVCCVRACSSTCIYISHSMILLSLGKLKVDVN